MIEGIHLVQVVDGSTPQQVGREGLIPTPWEVKWYIEENCRSEIEMSDLKKSKIEFPELGLPGVEKDLTPCGTILHPFRASPRPYDAKIKIFPDFRGTPTTPSRRCGIARKGGFTSVIGLH